MTLSPSGKILLREKMNAMFAGNITAKEYLVAVKAIYQIEAEVKNNKNLTDQPEWVKTSYRNQALEQI